MTLGSLDVPGWTGRIGGPLGRRARVSEGLWFDPVPWTIVAAIVTWVVLMARQVPCWQTVVGQVPNTYARMCYSDIPILFQNRINMWTGGALFGNGAQGSPQLEYPALTGGFIWVTRWLSSHLGAVISPDATSDQILAAANTFWAVNAALLAVCFGVLVWAHLQMGRNSGSPHTDGVRVRAWDALFIAAAPVVMLSGLINWDLFAVALTSVGLLLWAKKRPIAAGAIIGLAAAAKFYPLVLVPVILVLCVRAGLLKAFGQFAGGAVVAWLAANLPLMIGNPHGWSYFWTYNAGRGPDLGSVWYILTLMGFHITNVSVAEAVCLVLSAGFIVGLTLSAPTRPRLAQVALLAMVAFLAFNKVYSPQYVLWLLPIAVLARPAMFDLLVLTVSESLYYFAVWGFLDGVLGIGTGPDKLYWLSVGLRVGVQVWFASRVVHDMWHPWLDPVRGPFIDDPNGGLLDHRADVAWLLQRKSGVDQVDADKTVAPAVGPPEAEPDGPQASASPAEAPRVGVPKPEVARPYVGILGDSDGPPAELARLGDGS